MRISVTWHEVPELFISITDLSELFAGICKYCHSIEGWLIEHREGFLSLRILKFLSFSVQNGPESLKSNTPLGDSCVNIDQFHFEKCHERFFSGKLYSGIIPTLLVKNWLVLTVSVAWNKDLEWIFKDESGALLISIKDVEWLRNGGINRCFILSTPVQRWKNHRCVAGNFRFVGSGTARDDSFGDISYRRRGVDKCQRKRKTICWKVSPPPLQPSRLLLNTNFVLNIFKVDSLEKENPTPVAGPRPSLRSGDSSRSGCA